MAAHQYLSFAVTLMAGVASMMLAVRGIKRTKKSAYILLFSVSALVMLNGVARLDEDGDRKDDSLIARAHKWRAIEAPVMLLMLAAALWSLQADEKRG